MDDTPLLHGHRSLFLYPFCLEKDREVFDKALMSSPLWENREVSSNSSEVLYFPPAVSPILFQNAYNLRAPETLSLIFGEQPLTLHSCSLHRWEANMGCLVFDLSLAATSTAPIFANLLDFNESFRYIGDLYEGHQDKRSVLQVSHNGQIVLDTGRVEEFAAHVCGTNSILPIFDQRMIVFSYAKLAGKPSREAAYKFFNVDAATYDLPDSDHVKHFLKHHLYQRWQGAGTLYGFTHYSGGCLAASQPDSSADFSQDWLLGQFRTIYLDLALVLVFQLATLRQLERRLSTLDLTNGNKGFSALQADFIRFVRDYWYLRVTDQDQGRELFRLWRSIWEDDYQLMETVDKKLTAMRRWFKEGGRK